VALGRTLATVEIPSPPPCAWCGLPVGLWEPIVTEPRVEAPPTSWLALARAAALVEPIWHHTCIELNAAATGVE